MMLFALILGLFITIVFSQMILKGGILTGGAKRSSNARNN